MNIFEIPYKVFSLLIEVTHFHETPAQGKWADSDWDAAGYMEIEWKLESGTVYCPKTDKMNPVPDWQLQGLLRNPHTCEEIETLLLKEVRIQKESNLVD